MSNHVAVLFIVENDYFPRDARVYNECQSMARLYRCYVLAPRHSGERLIQRIGPITCYRFPHFEADSVAPLLLEYALAAFWLTWLVPILVLRHRIRVIHVANPPDFIIPLLAWTRLFGVKFIFDVHDLSVETFKGKTVSRTSVGRVLASALRVCAALSARIADRIVATNQSIAESIGSLSGRTTIWIVRNSNRVRYRTLEQVGKRTQPGEINIGYFGVLGNDDAAGLDNLIKLARRIEARSVGFRVSVVGSGPGVEYLTNAAKRAGLAHRFRFFGFVGLPDAFEVIKHFDFGVVSWGYLDKNHMHTAMKVMDYMCCAVPACSLNLTEQLRSTGGVGVHAETFEALADKMLDLYAEQAKYQELRRLTLERFNSQLSWELQERSLVSAYAGLT